MEQAEQEAKELADKRAEDERQAAAKKKEAEAAAAAATQQNMFMTNPYMGMMGANPSMMMGMPQMPMPNQGDKADGANVNQQQLLMDQQ